MALQRENNLKEHKYIFFQELVLGCAQLKDSKIIIKATDFTILQLVEIFLLEEGFCTLG